jgi:hypothetical protein
LSIDQWEAETCAGASGSIHKVPGEGVREIA